MSSLLRTILLGLALGLLACGTPAKKDLLAELDEPLSPTERYDLILRMAEAYEAGEPDYLEARADLGLKLRELLRSESALVRSGAVLALTRIEGAAAVPALKPMLEDEREFVRMDAAFVLGQLQAREAIPELAGRLKNDQAELVRLKAIRALTAIGVEAGDADTLGVLVEAVTDPADGVRYQVIGLLRQVSGQELGEDVEAWRSWLQKHTAEEG